MNNFKQNQKKWNNYNSAIQTPTVKTEREKNLK